ncbi:MAG: 2-succinyl-5-enolpyruvyl-6-hydroxy-3-cyclohexene-1-carboxylic-acid synthase [Flavobacteriales bacterium]|nr:2-succinyl-5-enolpyruvyl-6-hydroxy-3-cyclohexene-1-carboxylic-acid synthase [Flavobacteriales bacterium]
MISDKRSVQQILAYLEQYGIENVVISPGSRNAPLTLTLHHSNINTFSIVDERCAAFFALGIAQQSKKPVALTCTSGTALLNYAPAIAEAYYQRIPLVVLSADRPEEWLGHGIGQTIDQKEVYKNFIDASVHLQTYSDPKEQEEHNKILLKQAFSAFDQTLPGPIHINIPLDEPLYGIVEQMDVDLDITSTKDHETKQDISDVLESINSSSRTLILTGLLDPNEALNRALENFAQRENVLVMTESSSNLHSPHFLPCIDRMVFHFEEEDINEFKPEVLITLGTNVVSKKIKQILQKDPPLYHWHIDPLGREIDTFKCLTRSIPIDPAELISKLEQAQNVGSNYKKRHFDREIENKEKHTEYLKVCEYSDLKVFNEVLEAIPKDSMLQMGNSSVIRYIQLFDQREDLSYFANRGTSGIDGCTSTAIGAACASDRPTTFVSGDVAFFYDSNALWNNYIPKGFKIIIINNAGGGIFRIIPGPQSTGVMEDFFETRHGLNASYLAKMHGLRYKSAHDLDSTRNSLKGLYSNDDPAILEIFTPAEKNDKILRDYFKCLKQTKKQISTGRS